MVSYRNKTPNVFFIFNRTHGQILIPSYFHHNWTIHNLILKGVYILVGLTFNNDKKLPSLYINMQKP